MLDLDRQALARGVTAVSAGNHAIAVAYAAQLLGAEAKVVMPKSASPIRVARVRSYGGEVVLVDDVGQAFAKAEEIQKEEGRTFVHPYEGPLTHTTAGLEFPRRSRSRCRDHPHRRAGSGHGGGVKALHMQGLWRGAGRVTPCSVPRPDRRRQSSADFCRQPGRSHAAVQLRYVPAVCGRDRVDRR